MTTEVQAAQRGRGADVVVVVVITDVRSTEPIKTLPPASLALNITLLAPGFDSNHIESSPVARSASAGPVDFRVMK